MKGERTMKAKMQTMMLLMTIPLIVMEIVTNILLFREMNQIFDQSEKVFYDHLYTVSSTLINADRDYYQAMMAATQYYDIKNGFGDVPADQEASLLETSLADFKDNVEQTAERVHQSGDIAAKEASLYTGTPLDGKTYADYLADFDEQFADWQASFDFEKMEGDWNDFNSKFASTRDTLSNMTDITEDWAETEKKVLEKDIKKTILTMAIIAIVVATAIIIFIIIIISMINSEIKKVKNSITVLSGGNFAKKARIKSSIKDFEDISISLDEMRLKLKESITTIIDNANTVDSRAQETNRMIGDSRQMTNDINSAVEDIANGATSMAQDVMETNTVTMDMGSAVEEVLNAAMDNKEMGKTLYEESQKVQQELANIRQAGQKNDEMATKVSDSVGEMAEMVEKITSAADAIIAIASQTNLLSLNASIEAARAGEAGKGFAVVADEIKELAEQSDQTAKNITEMLQSIMNVSEQNKTMTTNIKNAIGEEAKSLDGMISLFDELLKLLKDTEEGTDKIVELVESLDSSKNTILNSVESLSSISEENAASTEQTSASLTQLNENMETVTETADSLRDIAETLQQTVSYFTVEEAGEA